MAKRDNFDLSKAAFGVAAKRQAADRVVRIPLDDIEDNDCNFYSMEGIEELAESIQMVGLLEPVRVVHQPENIDLPYRLISGHRRTAAFAALRDTTGDDRWAEIPALVMDDMDDLTETFALITANSTARELTYGEKCRQEQELRKVLAAWKEAGKNVPKNLGQYIADQIGVSRNEVSRMHSVNERLIPEAREKLDRGEMTAQAAYEMSRKPAAEQKAAVSNLDTGAAKTQRADPEPKGDAIDARKDSLRLAALRKGTDHLLGELLKKLPALDRINTRSDGIAALKAALKRSGSFGDRTAWLTSVDTTLGLSCGSGLQYCTPSELWDQMCLAALRRVSNLDTETPKKGPGTAWRTGDPEENDEYVCLYRTPSGERSVGLLRWKGKWMKYGQPVGDVYRVEQWTEVPK